MRKFCIQSIFWNKSWSDDQLSSFKKAKDCGFNGVEFLIIEPQVVDVQSILDAKTNLGLEIICSAGLDTDSDISSPVETTQMKGINYLHDCIKVAKSVGSPFLCGVLYAPWGDFPSPLKIKERQLNSARAIRYVAEFAQNCGIDLYLEILNRFETYLLNTVEDGLRYLELVDKPNVKLHLDTFHMNIEEDNIAGAIRLAGSNLGYIHCAENNRKPPGGNLSMWLLLKDALDSVNYYGWIGIETFPTPECEIGISTHSWRTIIRDLDHEAKESVNYLRRVLT